MDLKEIKGIGPKRALLFKQAGINKVEDLVLDLPIRYEDHSRILPLDRLNELEKGEKVTVHARLIKTSKPYFFGRNRSVFRATFTDGQSKIQASFFNQPYLSSSLHLNTSYYLYGSFDLEKNSFINPKMVRESDQKKLKNFLCIQPIYSLSQGLSQNMRVRASRQALQILDLKQFEILDDNFKKDPRIRPIDWILNELHFPSSMESLREANLQIAIRRALFSIVLKKKILEERKSRKSPNIRKLSIAEFFKAIPFSLTENQLRALDEILEDLTSPAPMNRLLQGDVGSGKTVIAFAAAYLVMKNGYQVALMAPTEVLAKQHGKKAQQLFKKLSMPVYLLTGSTPLDQQKRVMERALNSSPAFFIGTHSLFQDRIQFSNLALVITDEQHRFGVRQRSKLQDKAKFLNALVLSATPIPRTLNLVAYGDLDLTRLKGRPPGRKDIHSYVVGPAYEKRIFAFIEKLSKRGEKCYFICPAIEKNEDSDYAYYSVEALRKRAEEYFQGRLKIESLSGKVSGEEKEKIMEDFAYGSTDLLIATTVIEVGVDVPQATLMVVGASERFGLSQLHQLRGRVGRGEKDSYCIFILYNPSKASINRLKFLANSQDGFEIARKDLAIRGAGIRFGVSQHGFGLWDKEGEREKIKEARKEAEKILDRVYQNDLTRVEEPFKSYLENFMKTKGEIILN